MSDIELIKEYYDSMGEKFIKVLSQVDATMYCVRIEDEHKGRVSTLVEICDIVNEKYAAERDFCKVGEESKMIEAYQNESVEEGGDN